MDVDLAAARKLCGELRELGVKASAYEVITCRFNTSILWRFLFLRNKSLSILMIFQVDVTNYDRIEEVKRQINTDLGTVDILVNNAGIIPKQSLREGPPSDIQRLMDINVMANFWVIFTLSLINAIHP